MPKALVGFVIGRQGEHINNIQSTCGVRLQFQNGENTARSFISALASIVSPHYTIIHFSISEYCFTSLHNICLHLPDIPGTEFRAATISGPPDACQRAKKMVEDIVAEVNILAMIMHVLIVTSLQSGTLV